jgi:hypothetical protein
MVWQVLTNMICVVLCLAKQRCHMVIINGVIDHLAGPLGLHHPPIPEQTQVMGHS